MKHPALPPVTAVLAEFVAGLRFESVPERVRTEAKLAIADTVGGAVAAVNEPVVRSAIEAVQGESGPSPIWGSPLRNTARNAALVNGTMAHAHDIDDTNPSVRGHPSAPIVPAVLALGAALNADGKDLIAAYVAGVDVAGKVGRAVNMEHYDRGWHTTLTLGTLGAAAACGNLLGLDKARMIGTLSLGATMASGLMVNFGTTAKPAHAGLAAHNGVLAALLAKNGISGSPQAIEGRNGFYDLFCGMENAQPELAVQRLGEVFDLLDPGNIYKQYPTCSLTHCGIDAILDGIAEGKIDPARVQSVEAGVGYRCEPTLPYHDARTPLEGKFSMEYCLAAALVYGRVTFDEFTQEKVNNPAIKALYKKMRVYIHPELQTPDSVARDFTDLVITHADGRRFHSRTMKPKGDPARRWSLAEFKRKFVQCAGRVYDEAGAALRWERALELERLSGHEAAGLFAI